MTPKTATLTVRAEVKITATVTVTPDTEANKKVTWSSSNPEIVTVNEDGWITAVGVGEAIITATSVKDSSKKDSCEVTVEKPVEPEIISGISVAARTSSTNGDKITVGEVTGSDRAYAVTVTGTGVFETVNSPSQGEGKWFGLQLSPTGETDITKLEYKTAIQSTFTALTGEDVTEAGAAGQIVWWINGDAAKTQDIYLKYAGEAEETAIKLTISFVPYMSDAAKLAADKDLIEAGSYEIPLANQITQEAKTAWVQGAVDALIANGTTAVVSWNADDSKYDVALSLNEASGSATITVTEEIAPVKVTPVVDAEVSATAVTVGQTLAESTLSGSFKVSAEDATAVEGTLAWNDDTTVVNATGDFAWTFTPTDTTTYNIVTGTVSVTVTELVNAVAPVITTDLSDETTPVGTAITLDATATVTDGGTVSYQWYSATDADKTNAQVIADETSATYAPPVDTAGTFYYYCVVTNINNSATGEKTATTTSAVATIEITTAAADPIVIFEFVSGFDSFKALVENSFSIKATATNIDDTTRVKYKATFKKGENPITNQEIWYEEGIPDNWKSFKTNESGIAYFGPADGFTMAELDLSQGVETGFKAIISEAGSYTLTVELIKAADLSTIGEAGIKEFLVAEANVINTTQSKGYNTIQEAINDATENDIITASAGTYDEALNLDKSLTVNGTDGTIITGGAIATATSAEKTLIISGIEFKTAGLEVNGYDNVTISNNKFTDITSWTTAQLAGNVANAIYVHGSSTGTTLIQNNTINGVRSDVTLVGDGMGIMVRDLDYITITGNTISDTYHNSINVYGGIAESVTVTNNTLSNWDSNKDVKDNQDISAGCEGGRAIRIDLAGASISVEGNTFTPNDNTTPVDPDYVKITGYTGNVNNLIYRLVNNNTWPSGADYSTVILVNTTPGANMVASITSESTTNYYPTIQAAIDAAVENDTIIVSAGIYNEVLIIGKPITILGVNASNDARTQDFSDEGSVVTGGIEITGGDVTIKGLTIQGKGILASNIAGLTLVNNKIKNISEAMEGSPAGSIIGIDVMTQATGPIIIQQNRFSGIGATDGTGTAIRIVQAADSITITDNIIEDVTKNGINLYTNCLANENAKLTVAGNKIANWDSDKDSNNIGGRAIRIDFAGANTTATADITGNKLIPPTYNGKTPVDPEYVKLTAVDNLKVDLTNNYWGSASPTLGTILLVEGTKAADCAYMPYYTDEAMTTLAESIEPEVNFTFTGLDNFTAGTVDFSITTKVTNNGAIAYNIPLRYKAVVTKGGVPLAGQAIKYPEVGDNLEDPNTWQSFTTDSNGVAYFGPSTGFTLTQLPALLSEGGVTTPFQADFAAGEYSVTVSLLDISDGEVELGSGMKEFTVIAPETITFDTPPVQFLKGYTRPSALYDGTNYHLWYRTYGAAPMVAKHIKADTIEGLKSATPNDIKLGETTWEGLDNFSIIKEVGKYYMFNSSSDGTAINVYESEDGFNWGSNPTMVLNTANVGDWAKTKIDNPMVIYDGTEYKLYYQGKSSSNGYQIGLATSNSITGSYTAVVEPVLKSRIGGEWDDGALYQPWVVKDDNFYYMWYAAGSGPKAIGYAWSIDGANWIKTDEAVIASAELWQGKPSVVKIDSNWHMWFLYEKDGSNADIMYVNSIVGEEAPATPVEVKYTLESVITAINPETVTFADGKFTVPSEVTEFTFKDGDKEMKATFAYDKWTIVEVVIEPTTYTLTLTGEGLTSNPAAGAIDENTEVTVTVAPAEGQQVETFKVGGVDKKAELVDGKYTFTITANTDVAVTYEAVPKSSEKALIGTTVGILEGDPATGVKDVPAGTKASALKAALTVSDKATAEILDGTQGSAVTDQENTDVTATMVIQVTAENGDKAEYTIAMKVVKGTDATLSNLTVDGTTVEGFAAETLTYNVELAAGTKEVPTVVATVNDTGANAVVTPAASLPGATTVLVTAEDGTTTKIYTINFKVANEEQVAPTELGGVAPTVAGNDGKITGTTTAMEYKLASAEDIEYADCTADETTGLATGDYVVRFKAKTGFDASPTKAVTVPAYEAILADSLTVGSVIAGTTNGTTVVTINETAGAENSLVYKVGAEEVTSLTEEDTVTDGIAFTSGVTEIAVTADQYVTVYEINVSNKVVKYVSRQIVASEIKAE